MLFSDGLDVNLADHKRFVALGKSALDAGVVIDMVGYAPFEPGKLKNASELAKQSRGTARTCKSANEIGPAFGDVVDEIKKQYIVTFETDPKTVTPGKSHDFQATIATGKGAFSDEVMANMPAPVHPPVVPPGQAAAPTG